MLRMLLVVTLAVEEYQFCQPGSQIGIRADDTQECDMSNTWQKLW